MIRFRRGYLDRISEHVAVFFMCWGVFSPLVAFQSLLCARDDAQMEDRAGPTATEVVCPVLVVVGLMCISASTVSAVYKTAFEVIC
ncbi:hypothetical protein EON65_12685 [archaeon]|nr:MAG: hypothetical protein EON65_12685 [archaeon]